MRGSITNILCKCSCLSRWGEWLHLDQTAAAEETLRFLDYALDCLTPLERHQLEHELLNRSDGQVDDLLMELVAHQLFLQFGHDPRLYPEVDGGLTPDLGVCIGGQRFLADVFVTNSPLKTSNGNESIDAGERARKIADRIRDKVSKYAVCAEPLIMIVFHGDHLILDTWNVEQALYGIALCEFATGDRYPDSFQFEKRMGGCILPIDDEPLPNQELSAVIVCDWFDTLNRSRPGKRIKCTVLHHYQPTIPLSLGSLAPFCDVCWDRIDNRSWKLRCSGDSSQVGRLTSDKRLEFDTYSGSMPW